MLLQVLLISVCLLPWLYAPVKLTTVRRFKLTRFRRLKLTTGGRSKLTI